MKFFIDLNEQEFQFFLDVLNQQEIKEFEKQIQNREYIPFSKSELLQKILNSLLEQRSSYIATNFLEQCNKLEDKKDGK